MLDEDVVKDVVQGDGRIHNIVVVNYKEAKLAVPFSRELLDEEGKVTTLTFQ